MTSDFDEGVLVGILVGEGHFGGDGRQPHVTLRMHERHAPLFRWIERTVPGGRLYGPYDHGGRRYYQWMARGAFLRDVLLPILERRLTADVDAYALGRFLAMKRQYRRQLGITTTNGSADEPHAAGGGQLSRGEDPMRPDPQPANVESSADPASHIFSALRQAPGCAPSPTV